MMVMVWIPGKVGLWRSVSPHGLRSFGTVGAVVGFG